MICILQRRGLQHLASGGGVGSVDCIQIKADTHHPLQHRSDNGAFISAAQALCQQEVAVLCQSLVAIGLAIAPAAKRRSESMQRQGQPEGAVASSSDKCLVCPSYWLCRADEWQPGHSDSSSFASSSELRPAD